MPCVFTSTCTDKKMGSFNHHRYFELQKVSYSTVAVKYVAISTKSVKAIMEGQYYCFI